jgi:hypothetical protein
MTDDGLNIGVLFAGSRPPHPLERRPSPAPVADLEREFLV